nr:tRNA (N6-threonylcarbamoyladenosine(37)-N6)-methyltransferase TrmO [Acinetobacter sp. Marseille-Q1620]
MTELNFPVIGYMRSPYVEKFGIPRQPNLVDIESYIEMVEPYDDLQAFDGIEEFSHLWLLWQFHENKSKQQNHFRAQVRPPRLGGNKKIGVFASRSMYRPSPIGLSVVKIKAIKQVEKKVRVYVNGSDLLDGTPILDIKPYIRYSDSIPDAISSYAELTPAKKKIIWTEQAVLQRDELLKTNKISRQILNELEELIALDPKPAYQNDENRIYGLNFSNVNIKFRSSDIIYIDSLVFV